MDAAAQQHQQAERIIACLHGPERTEEELQLIVDEGVTVKDVKIEHPVYGDLTAAIQVGTRKEVSHFIKKSIYECCLLITADRRRAPAYTDST